MNPTYLAFFNSNLFDNTNDYLNESDISSPSDELKNVFRLYKESVNLIESNEFKLSDEDVKYIDSDYISYIYTFHNKTVKEIDDIINEIDIHIYTLIKAVMDCYFMRRFVDKPYIKNVIAYTGILNTVSCLYFLVKYYDYKILEYSFINKVDSKELEKIIKKTDSYLDIYEYIYVDKQCIKIKQLFKE